MSLLVRVIIKGLLALLLLAPFVYIITVYRETYDVLKQDFLFRPALSSRLYDVNGELIAELYDEKRQYVPFEKISHSLKEAILAAEDSSFYQHSGYDVAAMIRALLVDIMSGKVKQGGSTLTQQLAKQLYTGGSRTLRRKIAELFIARELERRFDKNKIFEMYCNQIYLGHGVYGVQSASRFFFRRDASELGPVESSILASLPSSPNRYSPVKNPRQAMERSKRVLQSMIEMGSLDREEAARQYFMFWKNYLNDLKLRFPEASVRDTASDRAPYFTEYVRQILVKNYGARRVYTGGLVVNTTLDLRQQAEAQRLVRETVRSQNAIALRGNRVALRDLDMTIAKQNSELLKSLGRKKASSLYASIQKNMMDEAMLMAELMGAVEASAPFEKLSLRYADVSRLARVEGALIAVEPSTGAVTAMVGGGRFTEDNQLNRTFQAYRQPGSAFKAFVYGAGIESRKITPATAFLDLPLVYYERDRRSRKNKTWAPSNYGKSFHGRVLARRALTQSLNITAVTVYENVGGKRIASFASRLLGVPVKRFEIDPTLALGSTEVTPLEMARGFSVYASGGYSVSPYAVSEIYDSNKKLIYKRNIGAGRKQIVSPEVAYIMTSMLRDVVDRGTATRAIRSNAGFRLPAAGKTGTNSKFRDAWFVGYTPDLTAAVWFGCNSQTFTLGEGQSGSVVAAPVWGRFMKSVYKTRKRGRFPSRPGGISIAYICDRTGLLPGSDCKKRREIFLSGTVPAEKCHGDHSEMMSIFDLAKKRGGKVMEKEKKKIERKRLEREGFVTEEHNF